MLRNPPLDNEFPLRTLFSRLDSPHENEDNYPTDGPGEHAECSRL